jgi:hypothetical protein
MLRIRRDARGHDLAAHRRAMRAARMEAAARRRVDRVRRIAGERRLLGAVVGSIDGIEDSSARV